MLNEIRPLNHPTNSKTQNTRDSAEKNPSIMKKFIELNPGYYFTLVGTSVIAYAVLKNIKKSLYALLVGMISIYYGAKKIEYFPTEPNKRPDLQVM